MKAIELTQGKYALVDDDLYEELSRYKWYYKLGYAARNDYIAPYTQITVRMHRFVINAPKGIMVDHINGNMLDNRKINLRLCNSSENQANSCLRVDNKSGYKGVCYHKRINKWQSYINNKRKRIHIGYFETDREAGIAYNKKAKELFGDFALINNV